MIKNNIKYLAILAVGLISCEPEFDNPIEESGVYGSGEADFTNFVALGNSLTAGFADNALYITGQENSYPNILAQQFSLVGGGEFTQPLMSDNTGGFSNDPVNFPPRLVLAFDAQGNPGPALYTGAAPSTDFTANVGSVNNMGIPGAKSYHLTAAAAGYGNPAGVATGQANPYFARFASDANASVIGDATAKNPTFFSLWIGNNDILAYATSGGTGVDRTGDINVAGYQGNDITDPNVFALSYGELITKLTANGAKGVVLSLPDVTSIPFFTTVPYNAIPLDAPTAAFANSAYTQYNGGIQQALAALGGLGLFTAEEAAKRTINFQAGQNAVVIVDEDLTDLGAINPAFAGLPKLRQATAEDLLVLTSSSILGTLADPNNPASVIGVAVALEDQYVLTPEEQTAIETARTSYNATIKGLADANGLAFYDAAADLAVVASEGIPFDGGVVTSAFVTGGGFSLDGVHPTPRGHAIVTNGIISMIERTYGANLPRVNPGDYGTVTLSNDVN